MGDAGDGTHAVQLTRQPGGQSQPAWNPSGTRIAFVAGTPGQGTSIWSTLRNGTKQQRLASASGRDESSPAWSPDGTSIAYQDCSAGNLADCGLKTVAPGSPPFDVSTLRAPYVDTFDGGDSRFWQVFQNGTGATNMEQSGQLVTTLAADSAEGGQYNEIETHWGTQCRLAGDFDVQADYRLLEWPATNGVQAALASFAGPSNIGFMALRESQVWGEQYGSWIPQDSVQQRQGTPREHCACSDRETLPRPHIGTAQAGSSIASGPTITDPASITLGASSFMERFIHHEVKVAWDNFRINAGTIACPTPWWEDDSPDWHAAP